MNGTYAKKLIELVCACNNTGEPTLEEKAKLLIAALDLGSSQADTESAFKILNFVNPNTSISRRSIPAICGTPSTEICAQREL